jgi:hypothetical protein
VARQPRRQRPLRRAVAVGVGGVDEVAARRDERVEDARRLVGWSLVAHEHGAEAEAADPQRAEFEEVHDAHPSREAARRTAAAR